MLSRDDYRKIKAMSKEEMNRWLELERTMTYNQLRKKFNEAYKDEVDSSVCNFLVTLWYTLHYNEDISLKNDELSSFMQDMYVTVDMFRSGEYKPEDYLEQMKEDGIEFEKFDYSKLYMELKAKYERRIKELEDKVRELEKGGE